MPPLLAPANTALRRKPEEPLSYQLHDTFEDYLTADIEERLRVLNQRYPLSGLSAFIAEGEITKGQWILYTHTCLVGQINNGGLEQFFDNCPGLILDVEKLLSKFGAKEFQDAYALAARGLVGAINRYGADPKATGEALRPFWADMEAGLDDCDKELFEALEDVCFAHDRQNDPSNWFTQLERRVLDWVLEHPGEFAAAA